MMDLSFTLDGEDVSVTVDPAKPLRDVLREDFDKTGVKVGCLSGRCGVCTVHLDAHAIKSCLVPVGKVQGRTITTIHGLTEGDDIHELQRAFGEAFAIQCGYCTPGFIMTGVEYLTEADMVDRDDIKYALKGNVCRCTGYEKIIDAFEKAAGISGGTRQPDD